MTNSNLSKDIISTIRLYLSLTFIVTFFSGAALLFITEETVYDFLIKGSILFGAYLLLFALLMYFISKKIKKSFKPLDKLVDGLNDDSIRIYGDTLDLKSFADSVRKAQRSYEKIKDELDDTKKDLDDVASENLRLTEDANKKINKALDISNLLSHKNVLLDKYTEDEKQIILDILSETEEIKKRKNIIYDESLRLGNDILDINRGKSDISQDYEELTDAFNIVDKTLAETAELIDTIFSEITQIQSVASQMDLYAMNTSIELARNGNVNPSVSTALAEINTLASNLNKKSDELALLVIRIKNSTKLSHDQSVFCEEQIDLSQKSFNGMSQKIDIISDKTRSFVDSIDDLLINISAMTSYAYQLNGIHETLDENRAGVRSTSNQLIEHLEGADSNNN